MNEYFTRIADIIRKGKISMRVKFMLQDVQDLRKYGWVPRRSQVVTVKTIDEVSISFHTAFLGVCSYWIKLCAPIADSCRG